jgi:hypothetical protein
MGGEEDHRARLVGAFEEICPRYESLLYPSGFRDSGLAVVSAVFSIQAKDESVRAVVKRFAARQDLDAAALGGPDREPDRYAIERLAADLEGISEADLEAVVFGSSAKSPRAGVSKAVLVRDVARELVGAEVLTREDVAMSPSGERYEKQKKAWTGVHGLGWVTFEYFRLLCGAETAKPDIMIHRWLAHALDQEVDGATALRLVKELASELGLNWGVSVSPRAVDHTIWFHQSERSRND